MSVKVVPRRSHERGQANHGWLKGFHTFAFAAYYDPAHESFGCLRVINEDRVEPKTGFGTHGHAEFEIFSYVISGELEHRDSMGNIEVLKRGDLQMTSAEPGSATARRRTATDRCTSSRSGRHPPRGVSSRSKNGHSFFSDEEKRDKWVRVVAPSGADGVVEERTASGPAPVHAPLSMYATLLSPSVSLPHVLPSGAGPKKAYIHVAQTSGYNPTNKPGGASVRVGDVELREGDGAYIMGDAATQLSIENVGDSVAEIVLFEIGDV